MTDAITLADSSHATRDLMFIKPIVEMPQTGQLVATLVFALGALAILWYAILVARRNKVSYPIWVYFGSLAATPFETFDLTLGHCLYPQVGQWTAFELLGIKLPLFLIFVYPCYIAGLMIWVFDRLHNSRLSVAGWWKLAAFGAVAAALFEPPAIHFGLWLYFGDNEPLRFFGLPFWWAFANSAAIILMGLVCYSLWHNVMDRKYTPALLLILPMSLFAIHTSLAAPVYLTINSSADPTLNNLAALGTAGLSVFALWLGALAIKKVQAKGSGEATLSRSPQPAASYGAAA